jgi:hypothetical protein
MVIDVQVAVVANLTFSHNRTASDSGVQQNRNNGVLPSRVHIRHRRLAHPW